MKNDFKWINDELSNQLQSLKMDCNDMYVSDADVAQPDVPCELPDNPLPSIIKEHFPDMFPKLFKAWGYQFESQCIH